MRDRIARPGSHWGASRLSPSPVVPVRQNNAGFAVKRRRMAGQDGTVASARSSPAWTGVAEASRDDRQPSPGQAHRGHPGERLVPGGPRHPRGATTRKATHARWGASALQRSPYFSRAMQGHEGGVPFGGQRISQGHEPFPDTAASERETGRGDATRQRILGSLTG